MKRFGTSIRSRFASVVALATCSLACAATGGDGKARTSGTPFDGACVAATVSELRVSNDGVVKGSLSVRNGCRTRVMLLLSPVRVDLVRRGQRVAWMGTESGRNAFVRMMLLQDGVEIDKVFAGDASQNVYVPLKALSVDAGSEGSAAIEGRLAGEPPAANSKGQLLLPCFPAVPSVASATVLGVAADTGKPSQTVEEQPKRLPDSTVLVHTPLFPIHTGDAK